MLEESLADPPRAVGRAGRLVVRRASTSRSDGAQFYPKPVDAPGRPRLPNGAARPRILVGGGGTPRSMRIAARYADEFNLSSSSPDVAPARSTRRSTAACEAIGRDPATIDPLGDGRRADRPRRGRGRRGGSATCSAAFGNDDGGEDWFEEREPALDLRDAAIRRGRGRPVRRGRRGADHAPGLPAPGPRDDRPDGRSRCSRSRPGATRRRQRPPRSAGRRGGSGPGSCRGRGRCRSVRSWSGVAVPKQRGDRRGQRRRLVDEEPAGRRERRLELAVERRAATIAAVRRPRTARRGKRLAGRARAGPPAPSRSARIRTRPVDCRRSTAGGRGGTSRGRASPTAATTPPRP